MSEHDTPTPEIDDEIRARLQAFAREVADQADAEAALRRLPHSSRPPTIRILALAACVLAAVALAAVVRGDLRPVNTVDQPAAPTPTTDCPTTTQRRTVTSGGQMKMRIAAPVASTATAIMLLAACGDDDPTVRAQGEDVEFVGNDGLAGQTLNVSAEEEDGEVTGEFRIGDVVTEIDCGSRSGDVVVLGGEVTVAAGDDENLVGERLFLVIEEGDPDRAALHGDDNVGSCDDFPSDLITDDSTFAEVESGDIETG